MEIEKRKKVPLNGSFATSPEFVRIGRCEGSENVSVRILPSEFLPLFIEAHRHAGRVGGLRNGETSSQLA